MRVMNQTDYSRLPVFAIVKSMDLAKLCSVGIS